MCCCVVFSYQIGIRNSIFSHTTLRLQTALLIPSYTLALTRTSDEVFTLSRLQLHFIILYMWKTNYENNKYTFGSFFAIRINIFLTFIKTI